MSFLPPSRSLYQLQSPIKSFARRIAKRLDVRLKAEKADRPDDSTDVLVRADRTIK
jgi:hypothetical protein